MERYKWAFIVFVAINFYACKKDADATDTSTYYIKAQFNGTEQRFSDEATATYFEGDITDDFIMAAKNEDSAINLTIQYRFDTTITKGVYESNANNQYFNPGGDYVIADSIVYGSAVGSGSTIKITISNLTKSIVTGTFSGIFKNADTNDSTNITNGEFNLPVYK